MGDLIQRLRDLTEECFDCTWGEPRAFFELPQRVGDDIRVIYYSYVARGDDLDELEHWFIDNVIMPLDEKAGDPSRLYWRLADCFHVSLEGDGLYSLRTRIAVLDKDLNVITLPDTLTPEGMPATVIS